MPEIEQFVADWYGVREESVKSRDDNIAALIRVIRDPDHEAIRALARNPLLLTIIALVHRIDAVLPDERVVLYMKCTETLLNTWHTWKFRDANEAVSRGKTERRHKMRLEAVAHWMQQLSVAEGAEQRAVVPAKDLQNFLANYIEAVEKPLDQDTDVNALSANFLEFIRQRAGLLIEVGDERYSFVHLTFQEYLAASYIVTSSERGGAEALWSAIKENTASDRWQETIRLLIASLRSGDTRGFIVDAIIRQNIKRVAASRSMLLLGCLLDGIDEAEERALDILKLSIATAAKSDDTAEIMRIMSRTRAVVSRQTSRAETAIEQLCREMDPERRSAAIIAAATVGLVTGDWLRRQKEFVPWMRLLSPDAVAAYKDMSIAVSLSRIAQPISRMLISSSELNFAGSTANVLALAMNFDEAAPMIGSMLLMDVLWGYLGPFHDTGFHLAAMALPFLFDVSSLRKSRPRPAKEGEAHMKAIKACVLRAVKMFGLEKLGDQQRRFLLGAAGTDLEKEVAMRGPANAARRHEGWAQIWSDMSSRSDLVMWLTEELNLLPRPHWRAALTIMLPSVDFKRLLATTRKSLSEPASRARLLSNEGIQLFFVLLDVWFRVYNSRSEIAGKVHELAEAANGDQTSSLRLAHAIRQSIAKSKGASGLLNSALDLSQFKEWLRELADSYSSYDKKDRRPTGPARTRIS